MGAAQCRIHRSVKVQGMKTKYVISSSAWDFRLSESLARALSRAIQEMLSSRSPDMGMERIISWESVKGVRERLVLRQLKGGSAITMSYSLEQITTKHSCTCTGGPG